MSEGLISRISSALRRDLDVIVYHANPHLLSTWVGGIVARLRKAAAAAARCC